MTSDANLTMEEADEKPQPPRHKPVAILMIFFAWLIYVIRLVFSWLNSSNAIPGLFVTTIGNGSRFFPNEIGPSSWTFDIWLVIYGWGFLWLIYVTVCICRKNSRGYFYVTPELFPPAFYVTWYVNNFFVTSWVFMNDSQQRVGAVMLLALTAFSLYYMLYISYRRVDQNGPWLTENAPADLWLIRFFVHNGLAIYATWVTIATLLSFGTTLTYEGGYNNEDASTGMLALLTAIVLVWFVLENLVFERFCRYTLVPYVVVVVALSGIIDKFIRFNGGLEKRNAIFACVLLGVSSFLLVVRFVFVIWCHVKQPLYVNTVKTTSVKKAELNDGFTADSRL
ncbi:Hypp7181 [Branchiostoma lanceolatum]|uniref:Hypp7181 protein n=1 Tax=Branchiostoma lanceolatum TaxID=7740 RepID=A0A8J9YYB4_BRALA|nr:Hypp7181 [Branchiostoma lanceolatum]